MASSCILQVSVSVHVFKYFCLKRYLILLRTADVVREDVCDMKLDKETAAEFELAVDRQVSEVFSNCTLTQFFNVITQRNKIGALTQYWYELVLDDLPMWGMVGEVLRDDTHGRMEKVHIPHMHFVVRY